MYMYYQLRKLTVMIEMKMADELKTRNNLTFIAERDSYRQSDQFMNKLIGKLKLS